MIDDKPMPQAIELEGLVLGALLIDKDAFKQVGELLNKESFYNVPNQKVFMVIQELTHEMKEVDIETVVYALRKKGQLEGVGGAYYIAKLTNRVASAGHVVDHSRILIEMEKKRALIKFSEKINTYGYDDTKDVFEMLQKAEIKLFDISSVISETGSSYQDVIIDRSVERLKQAQAMFKDNRLIGTPSGMISVDSKTNGWAAGDLIILAGRPSMGKSTMAGVLGRNVGKPVGIFTQEMVEEMFLYRLAAYDLQIPFEKFTDGSITDQELARYTKHCAEVYKDQIFLLNKPGITLGGVRRQAHKWKDENNIEMIIIDYLQLLSGDEKNGREQEVASITRGLKALAMELHLPIIALSQLSRATEGKADRIPRLTHLRESGAIEQDADMVFFIYRPEYYFDDDELEKDGITTDYAEFICAKQRNGKLFTAELSFDGQFQSFKDYSPDLPKYNEYTGKKEGNGDPDTPLSF